MIPTAMKIARSCEQEKSINPLSLSLSALAGETAKLVQKRSTK